LIIAWLGFGCAFCGASCPQQIDFSGLAEFSVLCDNFAQWTLSQ